MLNDNTMKRLAILAVLVCIGLTLQAQSFKVIVNQSNTVSSLTAKEISDYFLKKETKWTNGDAVVPVDLSAKSSVREDFSSNIHGKSVSAIKSYWQQYVFAGKGTPPIEKNTDAEVVDFVKRNTGAIGYVSANADVSGVKVLTVNK
jgi:ABC-type phosphate transport system substrate-binding protein